MLIIRRGVFETNSSSQHVLSFWSPRWKDLEIPKRIDFKYRDFEDRYHYIAGSVARRIDYLYEAILKSEDPKSNLEKLKKLLDDQGISYTFEEVPDDAKSEIWEECFSYDADHILESEENLFTFLFDEESYAGWVED